MKIEQTVRVDLGERAYDILVSRGGIGALGTLLAEKFGGVRFGIVTDDQVGPLHLAALQDGMAGAGLEASVITVPAGEATKCQAELEKVLDGIFAARLERTDMIIALGGGVVGDLAGFAAAIARRGMDFVQVPTSLLAQVDSSVGGKTGINAKAGKNLIGAFHQPKLVMIDLDTLDTLSPRHFRAGYAEMAKYGLIDDPEFFGWLEQNWRGVFANGPECATAVAHACAAKARVVAADEYERDQRALLNLGHTFGHALEAATGYSDRLIHGEGVSIGMVLAHQFSAKLGLINPNEAGRAEAHLRTVGLPTRLHDIPGDLASTDELLRHIAQDKKVSGGKLTFILTKGLGKSFVQHDVDPQQVHEFLEESR